MSGASMMAAGAAAPAAAGAFAPALPFVLSGRGVVMVGQGAGAVLSGTVADGLVGAASAFFAGQPDPALLVGILPFERQQPAHLYQPQQVWRGEEAASRLDPVRPAAPAAGRWRVTAEPGTLQYQQNVLAALAAIRRSAVLRKVVLARRLVLRAPGPIDAEGVLRRLMADVAVTSFAVPLPMGLEGAPCTLVGATPELLLKRVGRRVASRPLAGSARRDSDPAAYEAAAQALLRSDKDRREHAAVVEAIADGLSPACAALEVPKEPILVSTATMWHLATPIRGELRSDGISALELAATLHPTPAVCGLPREPARAVIAQVEGFDRGYYAGALGWCDARGDGNWYVAIRCAELCGATARLYAGAGIVPGSDPAAEAAETSAKFVALLDALGIDEAGQPLGGGA